MNSKRQSTLVEVTGFGAFTTIMRATVPELLERQWTISFGLSTSLSLLTVTVSSPTRTSTHPSRI